MTEAVDIAERALIAAHHYARRNLSNPAGLAVHPDTYEELLSDPQLIDSRAYRTTSYGGMLFGMPITVTPAVTPGSVIILPMVWEFGPVAVSGAPETYMSGVHPWDAFINRIFSGLTDMFGDDQHQFDVLEEIDIDTQLLQGEPGWRRDKCPNCNEDWHGLAITEAMHQMRRLPSSEREQALSEYSYSKDTSPVICPGSRNL